MSDGYEPWIGIAPEGKFPVRAGHGRGADEYADAWETLPGRRRHQGAAVRLLRRRGARRAAAGPDTFARWGITQGQGDLVGAILGRAAGAEAVSERDQRRVDAEEAADRRPRTTCASIQDSLQVSTAPAARPSPTRAPGGLARRRAATAAPPRGPRPGWPDLADAVVIVLVMVVLPILWTVVAGLPAGPADQHPRGPACSATTRLRQLRRGAAPRPGFVRARWSPR